MRSVVQQGHLSDVKVKSIYVHDTRRDLPDEAMDRDSGWVLQGVLSRASFHRQPLSGKKNHSTSVTFSARNMA